MEDLGRPDQIVLNETILLFLQDKIFTTLEGCHQLSKLSLHNVLYILERNTPEGVYSLKQRNLLLHLVVRTQVLLRVIFGHRGRPPR